MRTFAFVLFTLFSLVLPAQVTLPYTINNGILPADSDPIQPVATYIDSTNAFLVGGIAPNDTVPDFTLFDTAGVGYQLSDILNDGRPVLLLMASLTCPATRYCIQNVMPDIATIYGSQVTVIFIYSVEAHPLSPDVSPYSGTVWTMAVNVQDSAEYNQPQTYGQRKTIAQEYLTRGPLPAFLLLDGPGNEYWSTFGPAPNNGYLLTPSGRVYSKYGWAANSESAIINDIGMLLANVGTEEQSPANRISLFPNPSTGAVKLVVENEAAYSFRVVDAAGRVVAEQANVVSSTIDIDQPLEAGVYSVIVETASGAVRTLRYIRL